MRRLPEWTVVVQIEPHRALQQRTPSHMCTLAHAACSTDETRPLLLLPCQRPKVEHGGKEYALRVLELQPAAAVSVIDTEMAADVGPSIETEGYLRAREEEAAREAERQRQQQETAMREAAEVCLCTLHACICLFVQHHMYATVHALMVGGGRPQHAKTPAPLTPAEPACALLFPAVWHYKAGFRVCPPPHPPDTHT